MIAAGNDDQRWPISSEDRKIVVESLMDIIASDDMPMAIRASRVLLAMDLANQKWAAIDGSDLRDRIQKMMKQRGNN